MKTNTKLSQNDIDRFWSHVEIKSDNECWLWKLAPNEDGYGKFKALGQTFVSHRISYFITHRGVFENVLVCHSCDNRLCVNPKHLFLGMPADNSRDMVLKDRQASGEKNGRSKLTNTEVLEIRLLSAAGEKQIDISRKFGISKFVVWGIVHNKLWRCV